MGHIFRKCIACLLLVITILQTFHQAVICVDFYANQDYIAKTLCENRDRPMLHCCGRCQLRKRLNREAEKDKDSPSRKTNIQTIPLFREAPTNWGLIPPEIRLTIHYLALSDRTIIDRPSFCFHPPD